MLTKIKAVKNEYKGVSMKLDKKVYNYQVQKEKLIAWAIIEAIDCNHDKARKIVDVAYRLTKQHKKIKNGGE